MTWHQNIKTGSRLLNSSILNDMQAGVGAIAAPATLLGGVGLAPLALGIGGLGALGYGGYKLYKHLTKKREKPIANTLQEQIIEPNGRKMIFKDRILQGAQYGRQKIGNTLNWSKQKGMDLLNRGQQWSKTRGREILNDGYDWTRSKGGQLLNNGQNWANSRGKQIINNGYEWTRNRGAQLINNGYDWTKEKGPNWVSERLKRSQQNRMDPKLQQ